MRTRLAPLLLALSILLAVPAAVTGQGGTVSSSYMQTFDGMPAAPGPYRPPGWDVQVHSRDNNTWAQLEPMTAQHGPACEAPPATHLLTGDYASAVFQCHDHLMTAMQAAGYGVIYLTPPALLDWASGSALVAFDLSTLRTSERDWMDVWLSPPADAIPLPFDFGEVDLVGQPRTALHIMMGTSSGNTIFRAGQVVDGVATTISDCWWCYSPIPPDAVVRTHFELQLTPTHLRFGAPAYNYWPVDTDLATPLPWAQGVVQFGHHSYNPMKDCLPVVPAVSCAANTWHWDSVSLSPSVPITIQRALPRQVSDAAPGVFTLATPAPTGSYLVFNATNAPGDVPQIDVALDGGAFQTVPPFYATDNTTRDVGHARNYRLPVPAGTQQMAVRGQGGYWGGDWQVKDVHLWTLAAPGVPPTQPPVMTATPPAASPTSLLPTATTTTEATPTPLPVTETPVPPVATPTPEATLTPLPTVTPGATATPAPTHTALPSATATAPPLTVTPPPPAGGYPPPDSARPCVHSYARFGTPVNPSSPWANAPASQCR